MKLLVIGTNVMILKNFVEIFGEQSDVFELNIQLVYGKN
jgi:hypothetical protein